MFVKKDLSTKEIQDIIFEGMLKFRDFCDKHGLTYYIAYGTLLGAIRYEDFIPWDDDADIMMPRKDSDKLLKYRKELISDEWDLLSHRTHKGYFIPWMKFSYKNTILKPSRFNSGMVYGLAFDIFPIDYLDAPNDEAALEKALRINGFYKKQTHRLQPFAELKPGLKNSIRRIIKKTYFHTIGRCKGSIVDVINNIENKARTVAPKPDNYAWNLFGYLTFVYYTKDFTEGEKYFVIRGEKFRGPCGYDHFLKVRYGEDYMTPPSEEERVINHVYSLYVKE